MSVTALPEQLSDAARAFAGREHRLLIDGELVPAASGATFETLDPSTGRAIASLAQAGPEDVDRAVQAARAALSGPWGAASAAERARLLNRLADLIEAAGDELAQLASLDNGTPVKRAKLVDVWGP
ncbi:MAG: hypothetical protein QOG59_499, partial [Solirubrobacteraceae bacterium]|nr:hypothetical protein [Solirubrobacteraceae bacterium]